MNSPAIYTYEDHHYRLEEYRPCIFSNPAMKLRLFVNLRGRFGSPKESGWVYVCDIADSEPSEETIHTLIDDFEAAQKKCIECGKAIVFKQDDEFERNDGEWACSEKCWNASLARQKTKEKAFCHERNMDLIRAANYEDRQTLKTWLGTASEEDMTEVWTCITKAYTEPANEIASRFAQLAFGELWVAMAETRAALGNLS